MFINASVVFDCVRAILMLRKNCIAFICGDQPITPYGDDDQVMRLMLGM